MNNYAPTTHISRMIKGLFTFHPVHSDQSDRYSTMRTEFTKLAEFVARNTPASPEQTLAIRYLHIAQMQANAAIAINEDVP